jgi:hypothetical protein
MQSEEAKAAEAVVGHFDIVLDILRDIDLEEIPSAQSYELGCAAGYVAAIRNSFADLT